MTKNILIINVHNVQKNPEKKFLQGPLYLGASLKSYGFIVKYLDLQLVNSNLNTIYEPDETYDTDFIQGVIPNFVDKAKINDSSSVNSSKIDENSYNTLVTETIESFKPDYIALSIHYSGAFLNAVAVAQQIKNNYPNITIIAGGHHVTIFAKTILTKFHQFDYILKGECENTLPEIILNLKAKKDFSYIDGLVYRDEGVIIENPKSNWITAIDEIPFPDYSLVELKDYVHNTDNWFNPKGHKIKHSMPLLTSRSCPFRCSYCAMFLAQGPKIRLRSPENVVDEIEHYYNEYGQQYFSIIDDNFAYKRKRVIEICNIIIKRGLDIQFDTTNGYDLNFVYDDILGALIEAGFLRSSFSIESGDEEMRTKHMNKPLKQKRIYDAYEVLNKYKRLSKFDFTTLFVIGMPQETHETLKGTKDIIVDLQLEKIAMGFAIPYPGTELFNMCKKDDLFLIDPNDFLISDIYNHEDQVCIKPYKLEANDISNFRKNVYKNIASFKSRDYISANNNTLSNW
jgi:anaerobic magnesium-protoporphyrin IX monomethyl ester cyclase